jgi:hypothetical protein
MKMLRLSPPDTGKAALLREKVAIGVTPLLLRT